MSEDAKAKSQQATEDAVTQLMDLALHVRAATRADLSIKHDTMVSISGRTLMHRLNQAMPMHEASHQTIALRSGFGLGLLKAAGTRNEHRIAGPAIAKY